MQHTPVDIAIQALLTQVEELKGLLADKQQAVVGGQDRLESESKELKTAKDKADYRIEFLLRALEKRDAYIEQLERQVRTDAAIHEENKREREKEDGRRG